MKLAVTCALIVFGACAAYGQDDLVLQLEEALEDLGYPPGEMDGAWDDDLTNAVNAYKLDQGLEPNGDLTLRQFAALKVAAEKALLAANATIVTPYVAGKDAPEIPDVIRTEQRVPYHRIADCRFRHGLGTMFYSEGRKEEFHLTDVCFDQEGGRFWSAESIAGWSLTNEAPSFKEYKVIEEGVPDWQRHTLMLQPLPETIAQMGMTLPGSGGTGAVWFWQVPNSYEPQAGPSRLAMATGVFLDEPQVVEALDGTFTVAISMVHRVVAGEGKAPVLPGMGFVGDIEFDTTAGKGVLGPAPNGFLSDESSALVTLSVVDGALGGSTRLTGSNGETAGLEPTDWKSLELTVDQLYGRVDGAGGNSLFMIGAADGVAFDQSGREFKLLSAITVQGFRTE